MDLISSRWRKPKGRPSKKRMLAKLRYENSKKSKMEAAIEDTSELKLTNDEPKILCSVEENCDIASTSSNSNSKMSRTDSKIMAFESTPPPDLQQSSAFAIIHDSAWKELLKNLACEECSKKELCVNTGTEFGYSAKLQLHCASCKHINGTSFSSPRLPDSKRFEVNKSMVDAFLKMGRGHAAMETFSLSLGMKTMDRKTFDKCVLQLAEEGKLVREKVLNMARIKVRDEHQKLDSSIGDDNIIDIGVSFDGSWQKRGYSSMYCIGCVIDIYTGLIVDFEVVSKYCHECTKTAAELGAKSAEYSVWHESHKTSGKCEKNYEGSSASMEVYAAEVLWKRSIEKCKMRYTTLLSDGDSKTFLSLTKLKVYDKPIAKEECINHVAKRMGTALRNKVKEWRAKGVCLGGRKRGNLTEDVIVKLTNYYRKAIKDNIPEIKKMKEAIYASLYHSMSTNNKPQHQKCPTGTASWCFYNRALALGIEIPDHSKMKTKLSENIVAKILPVYQRLASDELLMRCTSGKTQNSNESVHSVIWRYCPKDTFVSKKRIEFGAVSAVSQFNMGCVASLVTTKEPDTIRSPSIDIAKKRDQRRIQQSRHRATEEYKTTQRFRKYIKNKKEQKKLCKEGVSYAAGAF